MGAAGLEPTAEAALAKLMEGNVRLVTGEMQAPQSVGREVS